MPAARAAHEETDAYGGQRATAARLGSARLPAACLVPHDLSRHHTAVGSGPRFARHPDRRAACPTAGRDCVELPGNRMVCPKRDEDSMLSGFGNRPRMAIFAQKTDHFADAGRTPLKNRLTSVGSRPRDRRPGAHCSPKIRPVMTRSPVRPNAARVTELRHTSGIGGAGRSRHAHGSDAPRRRRWASASWLAIGGPRLRRNRENLTPASGLGIVARCQARCGRGPCFQPEAACRPALGVRGIVSTTRSVRAFA